LKKVIALFLLTAVMAFAADNPVSNLAFQARDIILGCAVAFAEICLGIGLCRLGLTPLRGAIYLGQAIIVSIGVTHIPADRQLGARSHYLRCG
jgi:hypothetical protein